MKARRPRFIRNTPAEEARINAGIAADPDTHELSDDEIATMTPWRPRGRPKSAAPKVQVTVRLDPAVLEHFRAGGAGWQTRINRVLAQHVARQRRD